MISQTKLIEKIRNLIEESIRILDNVVATYNAEYLYEFEEKMDEVGYLFGELIEGVRIDKMNENQRFHFQYKDVLLRALSKEISHIIVPFEGPSMYDIDLNLSRYNSIMDIIEEISNKFNLGLPKYKRYDAKKIDEEIRKYTDNNEKELIPKYWNNELKSLFTDFLKNKDQAIRHLKQFEMRYKEFKKKEHKVSDMDKVKERQIMEYVLLYFKDIINWKEDWELEMEEENE